MSASDLPIICHGCGHRTEIPLGRVASLAACRCGSTDLDLAPVTAAYSVIPDDTREADDAGTDDGRYNRPKLPDGPNVWCNDIYHAAYDRTRAFNDSMQAESAKVETEWKVIQRGTMVTNPGTYASEAEAQAAADAANAKYDTNEYLPAELGKAAARKVAWTIDQLRDGVGDFYTPIDGVQLDNVTKGMLVQVYEACSPEQQAKLTALPLQKAIDVGWRVVKKSASLHTALGYEEDEWEVDPWAGWTLGDGEHDYGYITDLTSSRGGYTWAVYTDPEADVPRSTGHADTLEQAKAAVAAAVDKINGKTAARWTTATKRPTRRTSAKQPEDGVDRCDCGCKYWKDGRCIDCGDRFRPEDHKTSARTSARDVAARRTAKITAIEREVVAFNPALSRAEARQIATAATDRYLSRAR